MQKKLKKLSMHTMLPYIIICAVIAAVLLGISASGMVKIISGPSELQMTDIASQNGDYVSFDASDVIVAYATLTRSNEDTNDSETLETYYLLLLDDGTYIGVVDYYENNGNMLERAMEQSQQYYQEDLETLTKIGTLSGTVETMDEDMDSYMTSTISDYSLPGYDTDAGLSSLIAGYQISLDKVGYFTKSTALILFFIGLGFLVITILLIVLVESGSYQKKALKRLYGLETPSDAEKFFGEAEPIERMYYGKYIWYTRKLKTKLIRTEDLIWGYVMPEPLVVSSYRWPVALYDIEQNENRICFKDKKVAEEFLKKVEAEGYGFINGYTPELSQKFKTNFAGFAKSVGRKIDANN